MHHALPLHKAYIYQLVYIIHQYLELCDDWADFPTILLLLIEIYHLLFGGFDLFLYEVLDPIVDVLSPWRQSIGGYSHITCKKDHAMVNRALVDFYNIPDNFIVCFFHSTCYRD